jgi:hypothetical protein
MEDAARGAATAVLGIEDDMGNTAGEALPVLVWAIQRQQGSALPAEPFLRQPGRDRNEKVDPEQGENGQKGACQCLKLYY